MTEKRKLDIFDVLSNIDLMNQDYFSTLDDDQQKAFAPIVVMRWLSGLSDKSIYKEVNLLLTNELVNLNFWDLSNHPELQYKLMAACGSGEKLRHQWIAMPKRKKEGELLSFLLNYYPDLNDIEFSLLLKSYTDATFVDFLKSTGIDDEQIEKLLIEFKKETA